MNRFDYMASGNKRSLAFAEVKKSLRDIHRQLLTCPFPHQIEAMFEAHWQRFKVGAEDQEQMLQIIKHALMTPRGRQSLIEQLEKFISE